MANPNDAKVLLNQLQEEQFLALHDVYALLKEKYPSVHQYLKECEVLDADLFILRFLVGNQWNSTQTALLVSETVQWRIEERVDDIATAIYDGLPLAKFPNRTIIAKCAPEIEMHLEDKEGVPIQIRLMGRVAVEVMDHLGEGHFMEYAIYTAEYKRITMDTLSRRRGVLCQHMSVVDMTCPKGLLNLWMAPGVKDITDAMMSVMQRHYPEFTRKVIIVNAPIAFSAIWGALRLGLPQRVLDKINVISGDALTALKEEVDEERIPRFFGGLEPTCLDKVSEWEDIELVCVTHHTPLRIEHEVPLRGVVVWDLEPVDGEMDVSCTFTAASGVSMCVMQADKLAKRSIGTFVAPSTGCFVLEVQSTGGWRSKKIRHLITVTAPSAEELASLEANAAEGMYDLSLRPASGDLSTRSDGSQESFESYASYEEKDPTMFASPQLEGMFDEEAEEMLSLMLEVTPPGSQGHATTGGVEQIELLPLPQRIAVAWRLCVACLLRIVTVPCLVCCPTWDCFGMRWLKQRMKQEDVFDKV